MNQNPFSNNSNQNRGNRPGGNRRSGGRGEQMSNDPFDSTTLEVCRVTRVMAGGKRMSFRATVVVGDGKGRVGMGIPKGRDVGLAVTKAQTQAKKNLMFVPLVKGTIPHEVKVKFKAAQVMLKPAPSGRGIIAGGVVRIVAKLAGVQNIVSKVISGKNKINIARATLKAFGALAGAHQLTESATTEDLTAYVS